MSADVVPLRDYKQKIIHDQRDRDWLNTRRIAVGTMLVDATMIEDSELRARMKALLHRVIKEME